MMRPIFLLVVLLSLPVGCARRSPPVAPQGTGFTRVIPPMVSTTDSVEAPQEPQAKQLAAQWGPKLYHEDAGVRWEASRTLAELDEAAFPYVFKAMQSEQAPARLAALEALDPKVAHAHQREVVPVLLQLLNDKDAEVRKRVCLALTWMDRLLGDNEIQAGVMATDRLLALRLTADKDPDAEVRGTARIGVQNLQQAIQGKLGPLGGEEVGADKLGGPGGIGARTGDQLAPTRELRR
jgi:HEAT repeat protein